MTFETNHVLHPENLPLNVVLRFAEIDLYLCKKKLIEQFELGTTPAKAIDKADEFIKDVLFFGEHYDDTFTHLLNSRYFVPSKQDIAHYLLYAGYSLRDISKISGLAVNTVQKIKKVYPEMTPVYANWNSSLLRNTKLMRTRFILFGQTEKFFQYETFDFYQPDPLDRINLTVRKKPTTKPNIKAPEDMGTELVDETENYNPESTYWKTL